MGDVLRTRATHAPHRARILGLGLSVGIAIALIGCAKPDRLPQAQGGYVKLFANDWAELDKLCDNGRLVYFAATGSSSGGTALAVIPNAPECAGNAYVVETGR